MGENPTEHYEEYTGSKRVLVELNLGFLSGWLDYCQLVDFWYMSSIASEKRKETLTRMCDERARVLQDQFIVRVNDIRPMTILISTFHHGKNRKQKIFTI